MKDVEQLFIGSLLRKPSSVVLVQDIGPDLKDYDAVVAFNIILTLSKANKPVNVQTVATKNLSIAGWVSQADDIGVGANVEYLAKTIKENAKKRRVSKKLTDILKSIDLVAVDESLDLVREIYNSELCDGKESGSLSEAMAEFEAQAEKYRIAGGIGISTGFTRWDNEYITYEPGHLWAVGGFTSVGKTATALEMVGRIGACKGIAVFSMEMTKPQIISRMLSRMTGYSSRLILAGKLQNEALTRAKDALNRMPLHIYRKARDWGAIQNACRVLKMQDEIDVAVFDYQQNIAADGKSTHDKMETISRSCQDLCQEIEITGIMLSQISLQQNRDDSGSPEFKGGGGLAECADVALHLSRPKNSKTDLVVEMRKNRHGPKINLLLEYQDHYTRLEEIGGS